VRAIARPPAPVPAGPCRWIAANPTRRVRRVNLTRRPAPPRRRRGRPVFFSPLTHRPRKGKPPSSEPSPSLPSKGGRLWS